MSQQDRCRDHYDRGADDGYALAENDARIAAFGAIRRAATIARHWDTISADTDVDIAHGGFGWIETGQVSVEIRAAIRAAIGSPKA